MGHRTLSFHQSGKTRKRRIIFDFFFFSRSFQERNATSCNNDAAQNKKNPSINECRPPIFFCGIYVKLRSVNYILTHTKSAQGGMKRFIQQIRGTTITFFSKCATLKHETLRDSYDSSHNETFPVRVCVSLMYFIF